MKKQRTYIAIDLKSFYASVECMERQLDPLKTNLVVADASRTGKTICLAVSPSLKAYGISGRARLFEAQQRIEEVNIERLNCAPNQTFAGKSYNADQLAADPALELDYIIAPPRMAFYIEYSTRIYQVYLKYIAPEDIFSYSIDEIFADVTDYLNTYAMTARELVEKMVQDVYETTGITATAGIGSNLYLAKIAMDIWAKHAKPNQHGVRVAELDERSYRENLWSHRPLTDFWRVGKGISRKLEKVGIYTMGDIARCSIGGPDEYFNEDLLYKMFGINAELLIDHAWGWEPVTMADIKSYRPENNSISSGQVLSEPYTYEKTRVIVKEMTDALALQLVDKGLVTDQLTLTIGYDRESLSNPEISKQYHGEVTQDHYGRLVPKHGHGTANLGKFTSSTKLLMEAMLGLYEKIANPILLVRRVTLVANHIISEKDAAQKEENTYEQLDLFSNFSAKEQARKEEAEELQKEKQLQQAMLEIKKRFGKNAVLKGTNFEDGATARDRNRTIGGHKA